MLRNLFKKLSLVLATSLMAFASSAAVSQEVTDAIATTKTDLSTIGSLLVGLAVIVMGYRWMKASFF